MLHFIRVSLILQNECVSCDRHHLLSAGTLTAFDKVTYYSDAFIVATMFISISLLSDNTIDWITYCRSEHVLVSDYLLPTGPPTVDRFFYCQWDRLLSTGLPNIVVFDDHCFILDSFVPLIGHIPL
jgi:hypothetical protein